MGKWVVTQKVGSGSNMATTTSDHLNRSDALSSAMRDVVPRPFHSTTAVVSENGVDRYVVWWDFENHKAHYESFLGSMN